MSRLLIGKQQKYSRTHQSWKRMIPAVIHFWKKKKREMGRFIQISMFSRITGLINFNTVISMLVGLGKIEDKCDK